MKFYFNFKSIHSRKCGLQKWRPSCLDLNVLNLNPTCAETDILQENNLNMMAADALAPHISIPSAAMLFTSYVE